MNLDIHFLGQTEKKKKRKGERRERKVREKEKGERKGEGGRKGEKKEKNGKAFGGGFCGSLCCPFPPSLTISLTSLKLEKSISSFLLPGSI